MKKNPNITAQTRQRFIDAFWKVMEKNELKKITVTSITREAGYNRGTFYEYFKDIPDLLEQVEDGFIDELSEQIAFLFDGEGPINLKILSQKCTSMLAKFDDKLFYLLSENGDPSFSYRFKKRFISEITSYFDFGEKEKYKDYVVAYCYSALTGIRLHWYETGKALSFDEFVSITQPLVATGLLGFLGQDYIK